MDVAHRMDGVNCQGKIGLLMNELQRCSYKSPQNGQILTGGMKRTLIVSRLIRVSSIGFKKRK